MQVQALLLFCSACMCTYARQQKLYNQQAAHDHKLDLDMHTQIDSVFSPPTD